MAIVVGILVFFIGLSCGCLFSNKCIKTVGTLRIDQSDPYDAPYLFLEELSEDPRDLMTKKYVTLKVNPQSYISQK